MDLKPGKYTMSADVEVIRVRNDGDVEVHLPDGRCIYYSQASVTFTPILPDEPKDGTVVLDNDGDAWQRQAGMWAMAGCGSDSMYYNISWEKLNNIGGSLTVIHTPE